MDGCNKNCELFNTFEKMDDYRKKQSLQVTSRMAAIAPLK